MRYTNRFLTLAAILLVSCTAERLNDPSVPDAGQKVSEKICNTSENAEEGVLIAKFCNEAIPYLEQTASMTTKSGAPATRSGIASVDEILAGLEVTSLERVFPKSDGIGMKRDSARESATMEESVSAFSSPMESEMRVIGKPIMWNRTSPRGITNAENSDARKRVMYAPGSIFLLSSLRKRRDVKRKSKSTLC